MKFTVAILALAAGVTAMPNLQPRQSPVAITDELAFQLSLPQFTTRRNDRDPPTLDWATDGCTSSPDNPLGFDFVPACHRHDFGYHNFRDQGRFTKSAKLRIDDQFKKDLYFQCQSESPRFICNGLAEVYYAAVRAFGGDDATPGKRDEDLVAIYEEKLALYNDMVEEARELGILPELE